MLYNKILLIIFRNKLICLYKYLISYDKYVIIEKKMIKNFIIWLEVVGKCYYINMIDVKCLLIVIYLNCMVFMLDICNLFFLI